MSKLIDRLFQKLKKLEERATVLPSTINTADKNVKVKVKVDTSDEENSDSYRSESGNIFTLFNQQANINSMNVNVQIEEEDNDEDSDKISESGDTVYGQGTNPKPEDETYLNLLKKTAPKPKKIVIKP